ncbi:MAG: long-chain fatty acid--CoA ligase [Halanaeroarchaeum sp.]
MTVRPFFWRATRLFPEKEVVSKTHGDDVRYTYADFGERVRKVANALDELDVPEGARVGTFGWNHFRHFETYYAAPLSGRQLHTINVQLPDKHVDFIVNDAEDDVLFVDPGDPAETIERLWDRFDTVRAVVVMGDGSPDIDVDAPVHGYEDLLDGQSDTYDWPTLDEEQGAGMCYTSGTTGRPKGVEYTQKMIYGHAMMVLTPAGLNISESDVVMPVVPMFHVNSWEFPYAVTMSGAKQVYPGPSPSPEDLAKLIEREGVTVTAGVPTVWIDMLDYLEDHDVDISSLDRIIIGGSAAPKEIMRRYEDEYGVVMEHAWGMTETMSIGSVSRPKSYMDDWEREERYEKRAKQGLLSPGLEMRVVNDDGEEVPWDGETFGEMLVRGPTVTTEYYNRPEANEEEFEDGWLHTGDIATVDEEGYIKIVDRKKDVIKSGGEWISSIELENSLMAHDDVIEAAVIAADHERWQERPVAAVVTKPDADLTADELREFLAEDHPKWWLPDNIVFVDAVPKTATGKFDKKSLRSELDDVDLIWTPGE